MAKYKFLRNRSANGTVQNTAVAPAGQVLPNIYVTKQFYTGDVVDGVVSGNQITIKVNDAKTTQGVPYSGTVDLTTTIYDTKNGVTTNFMEKVSETQPLPKDMGESKSSFQKWWNPDCMFLGCLFTPKSLVTGAAIIVGVIVLFKYMKK